MSYSEDLLGLQNPDGGWSYRRGGSWTEPTCYALLGLAAERNLSLSAVRRGMDWLVRCQRLGGGFAPRESVQESVWLTALILLLPPGEPEAFNRAAALRWVLAETGRESTWITRLRMWMLGVNAQDSTSFDGWPWYPGAAAWVAPTALSILALEKARTSGKFDDPTIDIRLTEGRSFLLARRCRDGGWNHGSTRALGYDSDSYPEATGLALLALHGSGGPEIDVALRRAEQHVAATRSREALDWLSLGLRVHGRTPPPPEEPPRRGTIALALAAIAAAANSEEKGRNVFLA